MPSVVCNGLLLTADEATMQDLGLVSGQRVDERTARLVIEMNALHFARDMDARRSKGEAAPDTARLHKMLGTAPHD